MLRPERADRHRHRLASLFAGLAASAVAEAISSLAKRSPRNLAVSSRFASVIRLNETKTLLAVEPLHCSVRHLCAFDMSHEGRALPLPGCFEILERSSVRRAIRGVAKSSGRNSILYDIRFFA